MGKLFKNSARHGGQNAKQLRAIYGEPIIIPHTPEHLDETPLPAEASLWPRLILIGGTIAAALCVWWFAPELPAHLIRQFLTIAGR